MMSRKIGSRVHGELVEFVLKPSQVGGWQPLVTRRVWLHAKALLIALTVH